MILDFLSEFAWCIHCIALTLTAIACLRLSKRGASRALGPAAWLALAGTVLICLPWLLSWVLTYLAVSPAWWGYTRYISDLAAILLFCHLVLFAVAAFRTAQRLPAPIRAVEETAEQEVPAD